MTDLLHDEDLEGRPVVSTAGEDVARVDGIATNGDDETVIGLSLAKTGLFGGALDEVLPVAGIEGVGPDAVVVTSPDAFTLPEELTPEATEGEIRTEEAPATIDGARTDGSILFSEARTRPVVSASDGEAVGRVDRFVVDPEGQRVGSLRLDNVPDMLRYLSWRNITSFGEDEVTVPDAGVLRLGDGPREERIRRDFGMLGKRILTDAGHELGKVTDVAFDPEDGRITAVLVEDGEVSGERLLGVGPYAVVVRH